MTTRLEAFAELVHEQLSDSTVELAIGLKNQPKNTQARRILWNRSQKPCLLRFADRKTGGQLFGAEESRENQTLDRVETADVSIRAKDSDELEALFDAFCTALELAAPGTIAGLGQGLQYVWTEDEFHTQRCPVVVLTITYRVPVATETKNLVIIRATTHECTIVGDD